MDEELVFAFWAIGAVTLDDYLHEFVETLVDYKEHCNHARLVEMSEELEASKNKRKLLRNSVTITIIIIIFIS